MSTGQSFGNGHSLNGGGGSIVYNITSWIGLKADLQGYGSNTTRFFIPVGSALLPKGGVLTSSGNLFTYLFGPQIKIHSGRWNPFFQTLVGGAYTNVYSNLFNGQPGNPSSNAFAMVVGGGLDIRLNKTLTIRAGEVDYLLTRFGSGPVLPHGNQNGLRVNVGAVFTF